MSGSLSLFLLLLCQTSVLLIGASLVLRPGPPPRAKLGDTILLPCMFTVGGEIQEKYVAVQWLFQDKLLARSDNKDQVHRPGMFTNKQEILKGNASLTIQNVTIADSGKYTCSVIYSPSNKDMNIDLQVYATPSVILETREKDENFATCTVHNFYPREIQVETLKDGKPAKGATASESVNADGTYSIDTRIPFDKESKTLACSVRHESLPHPIQRDLRLFYDGNSVGMIVGCAVGSLLVILIIILVVWLLKCKSGYQKFIVSDIESPVWIDGERTTLACKASQCTADVQAIWVIHSRDGTKLEVSDAPSQDKEEAQPLMSREYLVTKVILGHGKKNLSDVVTKLTFIPSVSRHMGSTVSCRLVHDKKKEEKTLDTQSIYVKPKFVEPVQFTLCERGDVQVAVTLQNFYPEELNISWFSKKGQKEEKVPSEEMKSGSGGLFHLESKCVFPGELFKDPENRVIVKWSHQSIEKDQTRELSVKDLPWHPKLHNIPIESIFQVDEVHLQCRVSEYFPDALMVEWYERKAGSQELLKASGLNRYTIREITSSKAENNTFSSTAVLSYRRSQLMEQGVEFICKLDHPSLDKPIQNSVLQYKDTEPPTVIINNIQGPQTWYTEEKVTLYCAASYCKEDTRVLWMVMETDGTVCEVTEDASNTKRDLRHSAAYVAYREQTDVSDMKDLQDITSSLSFTPRVSLHRNVTITCKIVSDGTGKQKSFQPSKLFAKPRAISPIKMSLSDSGEVLCSLDIEGFYPSDIQIKWNDKETPNKASQNSDGTYNVHSECTFPGSFYSHRNAAVQVAWRHVSMEDWESRQLSILDKEFPWRPKIKDILVPNLLVGSTATLKCDVSGVFPDIRNVKWLKKERGSEESYALIHSDHYNFSELSVEKQKDNTFTYKTCLKMKLSSREEGAEFICMVEHPALERPVEKSTGPLVIKELKNVAQEDNQQSSPPPTSQDSTVSVSAVPLTDSMVVPSPQGDSQQTSPSQVPQVVKYSVTAPLPTDEQGFIIGDIQGPCRWIHGEMVTLYCSVSYCAKDTNVIWRVEQTDGKVEEIPSTEEHPLSTASGYTVSKERENSDKEGLFNLNAEMTLVPSVSKHVGVKVICKLSTNGQTETRTFTPKSIYAKLHVPEPVKMSLREDGDVLCSLDLLNFYPKHLKLTWTAGNKSLESKEEYEETNDKTFIARSQCSVPGDLLRHSNFTLRVTWSHKSLDKTQSEELTWRNLSVSWRPKLEAVPIPHVLLGHGISLQYKISNYFPDAVTVSWYKKKKGEREYSLLSGGDMSQPKRQSDNTYSCTVTQPFKPSLTDDESEFMCRVTHPSLERPLEQRTGPLHVQSKPILRKPIKPSLGIGEVIFSQVFENFYPEAIQVEWHCWTKQQAEQYQSHEKYTKCLHKTFNVTSECKVPEEFLQSPNFKVQVTCRHESMDDPEYKDFSIRDFPWRPHMDMLVPPLSSGKEASLQCTVKNYFPASVTLMWLRKDKQSGKMSPISEDKTFRLFNTPKELQSDKTYSCKSSLTFTPSLERDQGVEYVCRVEHPTLEQPMEKSTGSLQITDKELVTPPLVNSVEVRQVKEPNEEDINRAPSNPNQEQAEDMYTEPHSLGKELIIPPSIITEYATSVTEDNYRTQIEPKMKQHEEMSTGPAHIFVTSQQYQFTEEEPYARGNPDSGMAHDPDDDMEVSNETRNDCEMASDNEEESGNGKGRTSVRSAQSHYQKKERKALYKSHRVREDKTDGRGKIRASDHTLRKAQQDLHNSPELDTA